MGFNSPFKGLNQSKLHMFLEDLAVSATCVISTLLFRVAILLLAAGGQKCRFGILKFTPSSFLKPFTCFSSLTFWHRSFTFKF
jgi:hypothetical protein